jgi:hypothetical protein
MNIKPEILVIIGALISLASAFIGAFSALGITYLTKRSEERKHFRELIVNAAIKNWEKDYDRIGASKSGGYLDPLPDYVFYFSKAIEIFMDEKITSDKLPAKLEDLKQKYNILSSFRVKQYHEDKNAPYYDKT